MQCKCLILKNTIMADKLKNYELFLKKLNQLGMKLEILSIPPNKSPEAAESFSIFNKFFSTSDLIIPSNAKLDKNFPKKFAIKKLMK